MCECVRVSITSIGIETKNEDEKMDKKIIFYTIFRIQFFFSLLSLLLCVSWHSLAATTVGRILIQNVVFDVCYVAWKCIDVALCIRRCIGAQVQRAAADRVFLWCEVRDKHIQSNTFCCNVFSSLAASLLFNLHFVRVYVYVAPQHQVSIK